MAELTSSPVSANNANSTLKRKEEIEIIKSRLTDQGFKMSRYRDPLMPLKVTKGQHRPKNVTPGMEAKWRAMIREAK